jgi:hypothetical protein
VSADGVGGRNASFGVDMLGASQRDIQSTGTLDPDLQISSSFLTRIPFS